MSTPPKRQSVVPFCYSSGAVIEGDHRYLLWRRWDRELPTLVIIMLNPSKADAYADDATIRRCIGYAVRWGYGAIEVINLFAFRSTNPQTLIYEEDPVGYDNDMWLIKTCTQAKRVGSEVLVAWGRMPDFHSNSPFRRRDRDVLTRLEKLGIDVVCLAVTKDGFPKHPVRLPYNLERSKYYWRNHG